MYRDFTVYIDFPQIIFHNFGNMRCSELLDKYVLTNDFIEINSFLAPQKFPNAPKELRNFMQILNLFA